MDDARLIHGDALVELPRLDAASVDLIVTDPPYFKCKALDWDRQWKDDAAYLDWIGLLCREWARVLRPNGSLYCFASPRMAAKVECKVGETFAVLNRITWRKPPFSTKAEMFRKEDLRAYFPASEAIIFAEQSIPWFEPIRLYLEAERIETGLTYRDVNRIIGKPVAGGGMASHYFSDPRRLNSLRWQIPTREHYESLQRATGGFRRDYEEIRRQFDEDRRPFAVSADVPFTDVWVFATVPTRPGKHPCEKPRAMLDHIISASSRPGAVVLDCFLGSGVAGESAVALGREFIGIEKDDRWFEAASRRIAGSLPTTIPIQSSKRTRARPEARNRTPLFAAFA